MKIVITTAILIFLSLSTSYADDEEWKGFNYEKAGITANEYEKWRDRDLSRSFLEELLEYGVMPSEYFEDPWLKLGVSRGEWLDSKKQGLEEADIDRTLYTSTRFNYTPIVSFFAPGYFHYKTDNYKVGGLLSGLAMAGIVLTFVDRHDTADKSIKLYWPALTIITMGYSGFAGYLGTRFSHNKDAQRFSLGIVPSKNPNVLLTFKF